MYKLNQITEVAKEDRRKGELLIEKLQQILSDDDFFNSAVTSKESMNKTLTLPILVTFSLSNNLLTIYPTPIVFPFK